MTKPGMLPGGLCPLYGSLRSRWKFLDIHTSEKAADPWCTGVLLLGQYFTSAGKSHLSCLISERLRNSLFKSCAPWYVVQGPLQFYACWQVPPISGCVSLSFLYGWLVRLCSWWKFRGSATCSGFTAIAVFQNVIVSVLQWLYWNIPMSHRLVNSPCVKTVEQLVANSFKS